jgi:hypothetical protein
MKAGLAGSAAACPRDHAHRSVPNRSASDIDATSDRTASYDARDSASTSASGRPRPARASRAFSLSTSASVAPSSGHAGSVPPSAVRSARSIRRSHADVCDSTSRTDQSSPNDRSSSCASDSPPTTASSRPRSRSMLASSSALFVTASMRRSYQHAPPDRAPPT